MFFAALVLTICSVGPIGARDCAGNVEMTTPEYKTANAALYHCGNVAKRYKAELIAKNAESFASVSCLIKGF